jgi:hypothetical protein
MKYKLVIIALLFNTALSAQSKETVILFKKFIALCNSYKQLPLQLDIAYSKHSNIPFYNTDTAIVHGSFYIDKTAAYIKFGEAEQIITDSLALVVMNNIGQMLLSENSGSIANQVNKMINTPAGDSSAEHLSERYNIAQNLLNKDEGIIEISNKQTIFGTTQSAEKITLYYNVNTNEPKRIETVKRNLVKKPEGDISFSATAVTIPQKGDYLVKEEYTVYEYRSITHDATKKIPVQLADRIVQDASKTYVPVKAYQHYNLVIN